MALISWDDGLTVLLWDSRFSSVGVRVMMFWKTGIRNARVFPVPVRACARLQKLGQTQQGEKHVHRNDLHIGSFKAFVDRQALDVGHSLEAHLSCYSVNNGIAYHSSCSQVTKFCDWAISCSDRVI